MKNSLIQKVLIVLFVSTSVIAQEPPQNTQQPPPANAPATAETSPPVSQPSSCCHQTQSECGKGACPIKTMLEAKTKWNLGGEARFRFETRDNKDLNSAAPDHNSFTGTRVRLNVGFQPSEHLKAFIQPQFSEIWGQGTANIAGNGTLTGGVVNSGGLSDPSVSMHQAYANWEMVEDLHLIVGRQEFNYGDEVVIGPVGFSNIGRSFDAALVRSIAEKNTTDFFYSKIADEDVAGSFYAGESDFTGIYSGFSNIASIDALDLYGLYLRDRRNGSPTTFNFGTFGLRIKDNVGSLDYRFEGNTQLGEHLGNNMFAYMMDAEAGYTIDWKSGFRLGLEINRASGDKSTNSKFTRYHQLFPTVHRWLGYMDLFGRQNIQSGVFHALLKINKKWSASADIHSFWRVEEQDLIYSIVTETPFAGQAAVPTTGKKHVGEELDLIISYNPVEHVALKVMGGVFTPGGYFKTAVGNDVGYFSYVQTTFSF
jgi:hypothetical protein